MPYNALSDLRHFEIGALATGLFVDPPALVTEDTALAALWDGASPTRVRFLGRGQIFYLKCHLNYSTRWMHKAAKGLATLLKSGRLAI